MRFIAVHLDSWVLALSLHPAGVDTPTSVLAGGVQPTVGLAMMIAGLVLFAVCACVRENCRVACV